MNIAPISMTNQYNTNKLSFKAVNKELSKNLLEKGNKIMNAIGYNGSNITEETAKKTLIAFEGILVALGLNNKISETKEENFLEDTKKAEILKNIKPIISQQYGISDKDIIPEANFSTDLGGDSMDFAETIVSTEEKLGLKLGSDEELEKIRKVQDLVDLIYSKSVEKK